MTCATDPLVSFEYCVYQVHLLTVLLYTKVLPEQSTGMTYESRQASVANSANFVRERESSNDYTTSVSRFSQPTSLISGWVRGLHPWNRNISFALVNQSLVLN